MNDLRASNDEPALSQMLLEVLEILPGPIAIFDAEGRLIEANASMLEWAGVPREEIRRAKLWDLARVAGADSLATRIRDAFDSVLRSGEAVRFDTTIARPDGLRADMDIRLWPLHAGGSAITHVVACALDVSARNLALKRVQEVEARLNEAQQIAQVGSWELDTATNTLEWSEETFRIFEMDPSKRVASYEAFLNAIHPDDRAGVERAYKLSVQQGTTYDIVHRLKLGGDRIKWVRERGRHDYAAEGRPERTVGTVQDITAHREVEEALRQREEDLGALSDATIEALFVHQDGVIIATNRATCELFLLPPDGAVGRPLFDYAAPESMATIRQQIADKRSEPYEAFALRADGTKFPAFVSARTVTFRGRPARVTSIRDQTELRKMQASLAFADRMASVGTLAAGVAHEINNPLTFITTGLQDVARKIEAASIEVDVKAAVLATLREVEEGARRVAIIVRDLKAFSRMDDDNASGAVELASVVHYAARMAVAEIKHRAKLVIQLGDLPLVSGSETRLAQVFLNLLINAAQAIPVGAADHNTIHVVARIEAGRVVVSVTDTGRGMTPELLQHVFDPFVTTKSHGTGLGLAICHGIVTGLGGTIEAESTIGQGTTMRVALPIARVSRRNDPVPTTAISSEPPKQSARVLVIDDEPLVLKSTVQLLCEKHDAIAASSAKEAIALLEKGESFDAILCDLLMPEMTGMDLFKQLTERWPHLAKRVAFVSGGVFTRQASAFVASCGQPLIDKPFSAETLFEMVDKLASTETQPPS
ncbi:MAG: ATP-binding protein [Polyangiaceae bacterium]